MLPRGGGAEVRKPIEAQAGSAVYLLLSNLRYTPLPLIFWNHEFRARPRSKSLRNKNLWAKYCEIRTYGHNLRNMSRFGSVVPAVDSGCQGAEEFSYSQIANVTLTYII